MWSFESVHFRFIFTSNLRSPDLESVKIAFNVLDYVLQSLFDKHQAHPRASNERWRLKTVTTGRRKMQFHIRKWNNPSQELVNQKNCGISQKKQQIDWLHSHLMSSANKKRNGSYNVVITFHG